MNIQTNNIKIDYRSQPTNFVEATVRLAECYKNAVQAAINEDDPKVRYWVDLSRSLKAFYHKYDLVDKKSLIADLEKSGVKETLAQALTTLKQAEPFVFTWANRFRALSVRHFEDFESFHWDMFVDQVVPLTWDWESDLFVIEHKDLSLLHTLLERGQKRCIVIEPNSKKAKSLYKKIKERKGTNAVHIVTSKEDITGIVGVWVNNPPNLSRVISSKLYAENDKDNDQLKNIEEIIREGMVNARTFDATIRSHDFTWVENGLANLQELAGHSHVRGLSNKLKGYSAIIVSPGPSLEKNIELLKTVGDKAIIIAASHALRILKEHDIVPHVILHVDPKAQIKEYFEGFDLEKVDLLILSATAGPYFYTLDTKRKAFLYGNAYFDNWLMEILGIEHYDMYGSCVSVAALRLVTSWGCKRVALVGQDLSFSKGHHYAGNTEYGTPDSVLRGFRQAVELADLKLPGYYGGEVITKNDYRLYHQQFEELAKHLTKRNKVELFNCTEGGAYIEGYRHIHLSEFISNHLSTDKVKQKTWSRVKLDKLLNDRPVKSKVRGSIIKNKRLLTEVEKLITSALEKTSGTKNFNEDSTLISLQKKISRKMKKSMFLKIALQDELEVASSKESYENSEKGYLQKGRDMYSACLRVIKRLQKGLASIKIEKI